MNKIVIPSILGIILLVIGIYAFQPLDEATTVHTSIIGSQRPSLFVMLDGIIITSNGDNTKDPDEIIIFYDGIGNGATATIELDTNLVSLGAVNDSGGFVQSQFRLDTANAAGTWSQVLTLDTTSTGANHKLLSSVYGVRIALEFAGQNSLQFPEGGYVKLTVVGT